MTSTHNPFLTTAEAADYLRLSRQFLEIARHRGNGPPYIKLSRAVRYQCPTQSGSSDGTQVKVSVGQA